MGIDRRLRKTETAIQNAFVKLILADGYEALKISDLIQEADINKSTFYLHYNSLLGVSYALEDQLVSDLLECWNSSSGTLEERLDLLLSAISKDKKKYLTVIAVSDGHFFKKLESSFKNFFSPLLSPKADKETSTYKFSFLFGGVYGAIRKWVLGTNRADKIKVISVISKILTNTDEKVD